jgi:Zn-dependent protease
VVSQRQVRRQHVNSNTQEGASLSDLTLSQVIFRLFALVLISGVHGFAVAIAACALGDPGPRYDGRLSGNPLVHVDLLGLVSGVLFAVGWCKPVAIDPKELRPGAIGLVLVVIAGAAATLAAVVAVQLARPWLLPLLSDSTSIVVFTLIETIGEIGIWFVLVNLLPLPPLTGSHLLVALPPKLQRAGQHAQLYSSLVLLALSATGYVTSMLTPMHRWLTRLVLGE